MTQRSQKIIDEKKAALAKGDAGLAHEIGEGKDIMSICRASFLATYVVLSDKGMQLEQTWRLRIMRR